VPLLVARRLKELICIYILISHLHLLISVAIYRQSAR
jgi:hypothetical protein